MIIKLLNLTVKCFYSLTEVFNTDVGGCVQSPDKKSDFYLPWYLKWILLSFLTFLWKLSVSPCVVEVRSCDWSRYFLWDHRQWTIRAGGGWAAPEASVEIRRRRLLWLTLKFRPSLQIFICLLTELRVMPTDRQQHDIAYDWAGNGASCREIFFSWQLQRETMINRKRKHRESWDC